MQSSIFSYKLNSFWNQQLPRFLMKRIPKKLNTTKQETPELQEIPPEFEKEIVVKNAKVTYSMKHFQTITKYLSSKKCLEAVKNKIPSHYLLRTYKAPNTLYIIDNDVARALFKTIEPHLQSSKSHILEVNAGAGILTNRLVMANLPRLHIYEPDTMLFNELYVSLLKWKSDAKLHKANLLKLWNMTKFDRDDNQNRVADAFTGIPTRSWEDEPVMKFLVTIPCSAFIKHVIYCIIFQSGMCTFGRPEFFAVMPSSTYKEMTSGPQDSPAIYRSKSVLFQVLFEHSKLNSLPEKAFVPWMRKTGKKEKKSDKKTNPDTMYLVKLTPRQDLFQVIPPHLIKPFWFFVQQLMRKRSDLLIAKLEKWIPGCGPRLIAKGYTIFTRCGHLNPEKYLELFLEFSSWPDFNSSSFLTNVETLLVKMTDPGACEEITAEKSLQEKKHPNNDPESMDFSDETFELEERTEKKIDEEIVDR